MISLGDLLHDVLRQLSRTNPKIIYPASRYLIQNLLTLKNNNNSHIKDSEIKQYTNYINIIYNDLDPFYLNDNTILPWDILDIQNVYDKKWYSNINDGLLNVELVLENESEKIKYDNVSMEFVMGIMCFFYVAQIKNYVFMLDSFHVIPKRIDYFETENRFTKNCLENMKNYRLTVIDGRDFCFFSQDFLQGFNTGALLYGLNPRKYWISLFSYETNPPTQYLF